MVFRERGWMTENYIYITKHTRSHYAFSSTQQVHPQQHSRIPHGQEFFYVYIFECDGSVRRGQIVFRLLKRSIGSYQASMVPSGDRF
jgi:hypothetical protein